MKIEVLFFGMVKEITGLTATLVQLEEGATVQAAFDHFAAEFPALNAMSRSIVLAVNQEFVPRTQVLRDGDELAFMPPVSGGAGEWLQMIEDPQGHFFALTRDQIDAQALSARLVEGRDGAVVT